MTLLLAAVSDRRQRVRRYSCTTLDTGRVRMLGLRHVWALLRTVRALGRIEKGPHRAYYLLSVNEPNGGSQ